MTVADTALDALADRLPDSVRRDVATGPLTTYGAGGPAALAITVRDEDELAAVARAVAAGGGEVPVLVATKGVARTGLNIPEASRVIFFDRAWTSSTEDQAACRV